MTKLAEYESIGVEEYWIVEHYAALRGDAMYRSSEATYAVDLHDGLRDR